MINLTEQQRETLEATGQTGFIEEEKVRPLTTERTQVFISGTSEDMKVTRVRLTLELTTVSDRIIHILTLGNGDRKQNWKSHGKVE